MRLKKFIFPLLLLLLLLLPLLSASIEVSVCEGEQATLSCPPSTLISNITANYGRMSIKPCNEAAVDFNADCYNYAHSTAVVQRQCNGSTTSCVVRSSFADFGQPTSVRPGEEGTKCPYSGGQEFYLALSYDCLPPTTPSTTTTVVSDVSIDDGEEESEGNEKSDPIEDSVVRRCLGRSSHGLEWRETEGGRRAIALCPHGAIGNATWSCLSEGSWSSEGPSFTECASRELIEALDEIKRAKKMKDAIALEKTMNGMIPSSAPSEEMAASEGRRMGKDLSLVLDFVHEMTPLLSPHSTILPEKKKDVFRARSLDLLSEMISSPSAWESGWSEEEKRGFASRYLDSIEKLLLSTSSQQFYSESNLAISGEISWASSEGGKSVRIPTLNRGDSAILPGEIFLPSSSPINFLFVSTNQLAKYLPPSSRPFAHPSSSRIVSNIVTISHVHDGKVQRVSDLKEKMTVVFSHADASVLAGLSNPRCVWWDSGRGRGGGVGGGDWSSAGCTLLSHDLTSSKCQCDHLTHFALLMDVDGIQLSPFDYSTLTLLTRIGCGLSILCLLLAFLCFVLFSRHGGDRVFIHKNLCVTLATAQTLFVFTVHWTQNEIGCRMISSVLLYSFLSALLWMFVEGVQLYFLLVDVFASHSRRLKYSLLCFGLPLLIVGAANYVGADTMTSKEHCWLAPGSSTMHFFFLLPSLLIMGANGAALALAICIALRRSSHGYMPCKYPNDAKPYAWIMGSLALASLLGLTWSLGFYFLYDGSSLYVAYAFTILNSLQGFFIFILNVLCNQKMRSDMGEWVRRRSCCLCSSSPSSSLESTTRRGPNAFSPSNDSTALFIGGECSDSSMLPRPIYGYAPSAYPTHEEYIRHHMLHLQQQQMQLRQQAGDEYGGGGNTYETIAYGEMVRGGPPYLPRPPSCASYAPPPYLRYGMIPPIDSLPSPFYGGSAVTRLHQPRLPPPQSVPPLPPSSSPPSSLHSSSRVSPPSSSTNRGPLPQSFRRPPSTDDSAYSDSSSMFTSEVTVDGSTVLRMNLGRNPPLFQQDL